MAKLLISALLCGFAASSCTSLPPSEKAQLAQAAQSLTDAAFTAGGPLLNDAVMALPPEVQLLVQAGYGALRKAVEVAETEGIDHAGAQAAVKTLADTADSLHNAVHAPSTGTVTQP